MIIHAGCPTGFHHGLLFFGVFSSIALDFDDQVQKIIAALAIIYEHNKVGNVRAGFRTVPVGDL